MLQRDRLIKREAESARRCARMLVQSDESDRAYWHKSLCDHINKLEHLANETI